MKCANQTLLKFVGGPFDGFEQPVAEDMSELPEAVALPMDRRAGKLFGVQCGSSRGIAIYTLHCDSHMAEYRFHGIRAASKTAR